MNLPKTEDIEGGQAFYTLKTLLIYDWLVTRFSNRFVWHCPRTRLLRHFKENLSKNHLDIGVGTGYFLQKARLQPGQQRLGLLDINKACLTTAAKELSAFHPEVYCHDVFEPFSTIQQKFDTISLNYVLHCIPGTFAQKGLAFDHIKAVLKPGGKVFGATILGKGVSRNWLAEKLTQLYNRKKIFSNLEDELQSLKAELQKRFSSVQVEMQGCVALFSAIN